MRKIIGLGLFIVIFASLFIGNTRSVYACVNWCEPICQFEDDTGCPGGYVTNCGDDGGCDGGGSAGWETTYCSPGEYACNRQSTGWCCEYGTGGSAGGGGCWEGAVNCPAGATISLGQPVNTFCSRNEASAAKPICGIGAANWTPALKCFSHSRAGF